MGVAFRGGGLMGYGLGHDGMALIPDSLRCLLDQRRPTVNQAGIELHHIGTGAYFGYRICAAENAAHANDGKVFSQSRTQLADDPVAHGQHGCARQSASFLSVRHALDGVIATNTTLARDGVEHLPNGQETGGLSGAPVFAKSTAVLGKLAQALAGEIPLIGVGGILKGSDAAAKIAAGASLVQVYSGFIYRGPELIGEMGTAAATALRARATR